MLCVVSDEGHAIHYSAVERGTEVRSSDGAVVGTVQQVVDNYREHILDGIVIETESGELRFVDGPEVSRTAERLVTLAIDSEQVAKAAAARARGRQLPRQRAHRPAGPALRQRLEARLRQD